MLVNESRVITLRATVARNSPAKRAALAAKRLAVLANVDQISSRPSGKGYVLTANGKVILQVDPADGASYQMEVGDLAGQWMGAINRALELPPVAFGASSIDVGVGRSVAVDLKGRDANWAAFATENPDTASFERIKNGISVHGKQVGTTTISTQNGVQLTVRVLPVTAQFPQTLSAEVTGSPASKAAVQDAIKRAIRTRLRTSSGASSQIVGGIKADPVLPGNDFQTIVRVKTSAADALGAEGNVVVQVRNVGIERTSETELWYSNDPERVAKAQDLFNGTLREDRPVRLLYHHLNDSPYNLLVKADLVNRSDQPARIAMIRGWAKPNPNPVVAGLDAAEEFLNDWLAGSGQILVIPPRSRVRLASCPIDHLQTASGLYYLRLLPGGSPTLGVHVSAVLRDPDSPEATGSGQGYSVNISQPLAAWQEAMPQDTPEIYPQPFCDEDVTYRVGGAFGFVRLGEKALSRLTKGTPLYGNFGVIYRITAHMENPTATPVDLEIAFESSAGYSGALFQIDGQVRRINPLQPKEEIQLVKVRLEPGQRRDFKLLTLPLSGSAYPATIAVRPVSKV